MCQLVSISVNFYSHNYIRACLFQPITFSVLFVRLLATLIQAITRRYFPYVSLGFVSFVSYIVRTYCLCVSYIRCDLA